MVPPDTPATEPALWGALLLTLGIIAVGLFDLFALYSGGRFMTISAVIQHWSKSYPLVPFVAGLIIGHLFFPTRPQ